MSNHPTPSNFVRSVFKLKRLPNNVQLSRWLEHMLICRVIQRGHAWLCRQLFGSALVAAEGMFTYQSPTNSREITFNGRNSQFHALYEPYYHLGYEFETSVLLTRLAREGSVFYDIGANWGYFSLLLAASTRFKGPVFAFEPHPATFRDLQQTIRQAGLEERVTALNYGLGAAEGELNLDQPEQFVSGTVRLTSGGQGQPVPVHTLDTIPLPPADIIKIDAEGMEQDILAGGLKMLRQHRPFIVFENYLSFTDPEKTWSALTFLLDEGYLLFNPALVFQFGGKRVIASYGDPLDAFMERDSNPKTALIPITPTNRFLMRLQVNTFACHASRLDELSAEDFVRGDDLKL